MYEISFTFHRPGTFKSSIRGKFPITVHQRLPPMPQAAVDQTAVRHTPACRWGALPWLRLVTCCL